MKRLRWYTNCLVLGWALVVPLLLAGAEELPNSTASPPTLAEPALLSVLTAQQVAQRIRDYHPTLRLARLDVGLASGLGRWLQSCGGTFLMSYRHVWARCERHG